MRKLAAAAAAFSAAIFAACYFLPAYLIWPLFALFLLGAAVGFLKGKSRFRLLSIALLGLSLGLLCFFTGSSRCLEKAEALAGKEMTVRCRLLDYPRENESYESLLVKLDDKNAPSAKALIYYRGGRKDMKPGDILYIKAKFREADKRYGERNFSLISKGIYLTGSSTSLSCTDSGFYLPALPAVINHRIAALAEEIFPDGSAAFMKSLLLGDKSDFYKEPGLSTAMSRAGLMHIVAISGMHIVFLVGFIKMLLGNGRRSSIICLFIVWSFVFITGAGPSAVRAGIMQTILLLAPLFRRENDPITSLSAALGLILLVNPFAAASIALQLSFAATAGLLCFASKINIFLLKKVKTQRGRKLLRPVIASIAASFSSMIFTLPLTALHFGFVSLFSPISNVLCFWAVSFCFSGGVLCCLTALIWRLPAVILASVISVGVKYIILVARFVSALPMAVIYMNNFYGPLWLILSYALFIGFFLSRARLKLKILLPPLISLSFLLSAFFIAKLSYSLGPGVISALDVGQGQCLCIMSGDNTVMYDCGGMGSPKNAGDIASSYLKGRGRDNIDLLVLSHIQKDHVNGVLRLMDVCSVNMILMPSYDYSDNAYFEDIKDAAEQKGTEIIFLRDESYMDIGAIHLRFILPWEAKDINDNSVIMQASVGSYDMLSTGDASDDVEWELIQNYEFSDLELLIAGHHGSKSSSSLKFLKFAGAETAIISCGYNSYGHPSEEVLERLDLCGYNVFRTDTDGTVEIRIGKEYG